MGTRGLDAVLGAVLMETLMWYGLRGVRGVTARGAASSQQLPRGSLLALVLLSTLVNDVGDGAEAPSQGCW